MALLDSGNLLAHAAINAEFHERLRILTEDTKIRARAANKQALEIRGVSKGIYLRFPNITKTFFMKPLVVKNLSCNLDLGTQFNFKTGLIPQKVVQGKDGKKPISVSLMASRYDYSSRMYRMQPYKELWVTRSSYSG